MKKETIKKLFKIAKKNMVSLEGRNDFEQHWNDEEDFFDVSIWSVQISLMEAYELGRKEAKDKIKKEE